MSAASPSSSDENQLLCVGNSRCQIPVCSTRDLAAVKSACKDILPAGIQSSTNSNHFPLSRASYMASVLRRHSCISHALHSTTNSTPRCGLLFCLRRRAGQSSPHQVPDTVVALACVAPVPSPRVDALKWKGRPRGAANSLPLTRIRAIYLVRSRAASFTFPTAS